MMKLIKPNLKKITIKNFKILEDKNKTTTNIRSRSGLFWQLSGSFTYPTAVEKENIIEDVGNTKEIYICDAEYDFNPALSTFRREVLNKENENAKNTELKGTIYFGKNSSYSIKNFKNTYKNLKITKNFKEADYIVLNRSHLNTISHQLHQLNWSSAYLKVNPDIDKEKVKLLACSKDRDPQNQYYINTDPIIELLEMIDHYVDQSKIGNKIEFFYEDHLKTDFTLTHTTDLDLDLFKSLLSLLSEKPTVSNTNLKLAIKLLNGVNLNANHEKFAVLLSLINERIIESVISSIKCSREGRLMIKNFQLEINLQLKSIKEEKGFFNITRADVLLQYSFINLPKLYKKDPDIANLFFNKLINSNELKLQLNAENNT